MKTAELRDKFGGYWGKHPDYPVEDWTYEVGIGDTRLGYWDWVAAKIEEEPTFKDYTVFGFNTDSMQRYCDHVKAISPEHAETAAAVNLWEGAQIGIVGVIEGHHHCKDSSDRVTVRDGLRPADCEATNG
jgi:hypothetical protein